MWLDHKGMIQNLQIIQIRKYLKEANQLSLCIFVTDKDNSLSADDKDNTIPEKFWYTWSMRWPLV